MTIYCTCSLDLEAVETADNPSSRPKRQTSARGETLTTYRAIAAAVGQTIDDRTAVS